MEFTNLSTANWATADRTITYTYDDNGALESKTTEVTSTSAVEEVVSYVYNLQGRQARVITDDDPGSGSNVVEVTDYTYNGSGVRVRAYRFRVAQDLLNTGSEQTSATDKQTTLYLIDPDNPTGYAQTVAELVYNAADPDPASTPASVRSYTIGDDMIAQTDVPGDSTETEYLLYDGHGSTRQLIDDAQAVVDSFSYDGYGMMLGGNPTSSTPAATNLLYTGEHYDTDASQYYLRARWYDPSNGRFNRVDPYAGNTQDPQSLHKYLYCHANPVNAIDPSGNAFLGITMAMFIRVMIFSLVFGALWTLIQYGRGLRGWDLFWSWAFATGVPALLLLGGLCSVVALQVIAIGVGWGLLALAGIHYGNKIRKGEFNGWDAAEVLLLLLAWAAAKHYVLPGSNSPSRSGGGYREFHHGTNSINAKAILENGPEPSLVEGGKYLCTTPPPEEMPTGEPFAVYAGEYAASKAHYQGGRPVILRILVPEECIPAVRPSDPVPWGGDEFWLDAATIRTLFKQGKVIIEPAAELGANPGEVSGSQ